MSNPRVGVVGAGALGRHHVRIFSEMPDVTMVGFFDSDEERAKAIAMEHGATSFGSFEALADQLDIAVVAAPTAVHADLGCDLLRRGVHVMVEKPIAPNLEEADRLIDAAERAGKVLGVGHVEFYNPAVNALLAGDLEPGFVEVQRLGIFSPRSLDIDVILDLMIHDIQILHALDPSEVVEVRSTGINVLSPTVDIANARIELASGCVCNLTASRVSDTKIRKLRVFSKEMYCSLDYQEQEIKGYRLATQGG